MANGNRDFMEDLMLVVRNFHDLPWDNERFAEALEHMWHRGIDRGKALERDKSRSATVRAEDASDPADEGNEVPV